MQPSRKPRVYPDESRPNVDAYRWGEDPVFGGLVWSVYPAPERRVIRTGTTARIQSNGSLGFMFRHVSRERPPDGSVSAYGEEKDLNACLKPSVSCVGKLPQSWATNGWGVKTESGTETDTETDTESGRETGGVTDGKIGGKPGGKPGGYQVDTRWIPSGKQVGKQDASRGLHGFGSDHEIGHGNGTGTGDCTRQFRFIRLFWGVARNRGGFSEALLRCPRLAGRYVNLLQ